MALSLTSFLDSEFPSIWGLLRFFFLFLVLKDVTYLHCFSSIFSSLLRLIHVLYFSLVSLFPFWAYILWQDIILFVIAFPRYVAVPLTRVSGTFIFISSNLLGKLNLCVSFSSAYYSSVLFGGVSHLLSYNLLGCSSDARYSLPCGVFQQYNFIFQYSFIPI